MASDLECDQVLMRSCLVSPCHLGSKIRLRGLMIGQVVVDEGGQGDAWVGDSGVLWVSSV